MTTLTKLGLINDVSILLTDFLGPLLFKADLSTLESLLPVNLVINYGESKNDLRSSFLLVLRESSSSLLPALPSTYSLTLTTF